MTKKEIRKLYLESIDKYFKYALSCSNNKTFDKLCALWKDPNLGYSLFYPMLNIMKTDEGSFDGICRLFSWLEYCWNDDGYTAFVCSNISSPYTLDDRKIYTRDIMFIMSGEHDNIPVNNILKNSITHYRQTPSTLNSYFATIFSKEDLEFLFNLIPESEKISIMADNYTSKKDIYEYYAARKILEEKIKQHFLNSEYIYQYTAT